MNDGVSTVIPAYTITKKILAASLNVDNSSSVMRFHPVSSGLFRGNYHTGLMAAALKILIGISDCQMINLLK